MGAKQGGIPPAIPVAFPPIPKPVSTCKARVAAMDSALDEELERLEKLERLKVHYGWTDDSAEYLKALKQIKQAGRDGRAGALRKDEKGGVFQGRSWQPRLPAPDKWAFVGKANAKSFEQAKPLLQKVHKGKWVNYRHAPNSKAEEKKPTIRYITRHEADGDFHARLVDNLDGTFRVDIPHWDPSEVEDSELEDSAQAEAAGASATKEKQPKPAAKPAAAPQKKKRAPPPPPSAPDPPPSGKRTRGAAPRE